MRALAALFLLNIYFKNETFDLKDKNNDNFTKDFSDLFEIKVHTWRGSGTSKDSYMKNSDFDECVYFIKWTDKDKKRLSNWNAEQNKILNEIIFSHPNVNKYIKENLIENGLFKPDEFIAFLKNHGYRKCFDIKEYGEMINRADVEASKKLNFDFKSEMNFEAVLNKNQEIYTE